ncbi:hypothetical protein GP486_001147 [Trichoglossum hirsutum]|uniref:Uncharacterized protein n=1 Tax=Trichoglossum hirsutum TaxID=265104 RepID=A0A9P8LHF2_9PEZI|nr:hypothetical protein GP486_001147 [Trichoglossum hirsutum]
MWAPILSIVALFLSVTAAQTPVHCDHNRRPSPFPEVSNLVRLVNDSKVSACQHLRPSASGTASATFQGYVLYGAFDPKTSPNATTRCQQAIDMIVNQCILNGTTYGGEFDEDGSMFNLTNDKAPDSPILSGIGVQPTTLHTSRTKGTVSSSGTPLILSQSGSSSLSLSPSGVAGANTTTTPSASLPSIAATANPSGNQGASSLTASSTPMSNVTQPDAVAFHVPTLTATVSLALPLPTATASITATSGFIVTNPKNPKETVGFTSTTIPPSQRSNFPDSSDHNPALLVVGGLLSENMPYPTLADIDDPVSMIGGTLFFAPATGLVSSASLSAQNSTASSTRSTDPASTVIPETSSISRPSPLTTTPPPSSPSRGTKTSGSPTSTAPSGTLNCHQNIPTEGPSSQDIANSLKKNGGVSNVCAAKFNGSGNSKQETFNHGQLNIVVSRSSEKVALRYCEDAMNAIINVCVLSSHDYGGVWTLDGEAYNITNIVFPNNPLIPGLDGGSQPSTTPKPGGTKPSPTLGPARTVTTDGGICIIQPDSNDPFCTPTSTPIPNPNGTNIHVNSGCISINGSPRCQGTSPYNVASQNQQYSQATIYAKFDVNVTIAGDVTPGCELNARWPSNYGDIYFGEDNCLYDGEGKRIYDECCNGSTNAKIQNPYQTVNTLCFSDDGPLKLYISYTIFINGWASDGGTKLKQEIGGCGAVTAWKFQNTINKDTNNSRARYQYVATFNIDSLVKGGCVGRAIGSAGGPSGVGC